jgi:hypothetical protein
MTVLFWCVDDCVFDCVDVTCGKKTLSEDFFSGKKILSGDF